MVYRQTLQNQPAKPIPLASRPQMTQNQQYALQNLGSFVPDERRRAIAQTGISSQMQNIMNLDKAANENQTLARYGIIQQKQAAENAYYSGANNVQGEMKKMQREDQKRAAQKIVDDNRWGPDSNHIGVQAAQQVLANQDIYNADGPGTVLAAQGNMSEYLNGRGSAELRQRAADNDFLAQYEYSPDTAYKGGWGFGYKSMGTEANQIHSDTTAFGGDGHQADIQDMQAGNDARYAERNKQRWDAAMRQSVGGAGKYIGASPEYLNNIKTWSKQPKNTWIDTKTGGLVRMEYDNDGNVSGVSDRKGDTYTPRENPDGKYQNWNWIRDNPSQYKGPAQNTPPLIKPTLADMDTPAAPQKDPLSNDFAEPLNPDPVSSYEAGQDWQEGEDALAKEEEDSNGQNWVERDGRMVAADDYGRPLDERGAKIGTADAFIRSGGDSKYIEPDTTRLGMGQEQRNETPKPAQQVPKEIQELAKNNPQAGLDAFNAWVMGGNKSSDIKAPTGDQRATGGDLVGNPGDLRFINNESVGRYGGVDRVLQPGDTSAANIPNAGINSEAYAKQLLNTPTNQLASYSYPGLPAMMAAAEAPQLTRGDAAYSRHANNPMAAGMIDVAMNNMGPTDNRAKPASRPQDLAQFEGAFGGKLSPAVQSRQMQGELFDNGMAASKIDQTNREAEGMKQWQAALQNAADPRQQIISNGFKKLMTTNPPMAKFLSAIYRQ